MLWKNEGRDSNLEDRRGTSGGLGGRSMGIGGTAVLLVLSLVFGRNFFEDPAATSIVSQGAPGGQAAGLSPEDSAREEPEVLFLSAVLRDNQRVWAEALPRAGAQYHDARLVLYRDAFPTACGTGQAAMGPFYCPSDQKVYLDLSFFDEMKTKFKASGDFAQAYVVAHEIGHHVQHILGTDRQMRQAVQGGADQNDMSVRLELQADCYAGIWAHSSQSRNNLEAGDVDEAMTAAASVGDDTIQRRTTGRIRPESFTHGSAAQRTSWFRRGFDSGDVRNCDTFAGR